MAIQSGNQNQQNTSTSTITNINILSNNEIDEIMQNRQDFNLVIPL